ncbi:MAG: CoA-binding protein [Bacteroidota bacterium]
MSENTFVPSDDRLRSILTSAKTIAVVGLSDKPERDSYIVAEYLLNNGYTVFPVNPKATSILGMQTYPNLRSVPHSIDIVDVFRRPEAVPPIVDETIEIGAPILWLQLGVINEEAAQRALSHGITVIMNRCIKIEHNRLFSIR